MTLDLKLQSVASPQYVIHHDCTLPGISVLEILFHLLFWKIAFLSLRGVTEERNSLKAFSPELDMIHKKESGNNVFQVI